ncbi:Acireductone dioxygenase [Saitoella complicata NRRL Y-17804]|nr:Acireductone dioxygenase [Saitoella complicata NRRL Y-17804]ODQ51932.1 Acireductone dioxygenase [Saitoella complicata NRRL Y-17804]
MRAYYYAGEGDQKEPHEGAPVTQEKLDQLGVLAWHFEGDSLEGVEAVAKERDYKNRDTVTISPTSLGDLYESKIRTFFDEHLHEDEEIRYILDGEGYFDVRSKNDEWIRLHMVKGDLAVLPAGIYHRFTPAMSNYTKALRLFKDEPKWTPVSRAEKTTDENPYRLQYVKQFVSA